jgi:hypothetical protein
MVVKDLGEVGLQSRNSNSILGYLRPRILLEKLFLLSMSVSDSVTVIFLLGGTVPNSEPTMSKDVGLVQCDFDDLISAPVNCP